MTTSEVAQMVAEVGVPYAYYQFTNDTAQPCPFICFYFTDSDDMSADNTNYAKVRRLIIELYTENKDFDMENAVETVINRHGFFYSKNEVYIDSERMYEVIYECEVIING